MNKEKKYTLIKELLSGSLSRAKRQEIAAMDAVDNELNKQWDESGKQMVNNQAKEKIWKNIHKKLEKKNNYQVHPVLWRSVAACAAILLIIGGSWYFSHTGRNSGNDFIEITAPNNLTYTLPDSSKVWMEKGSKLRFPKAFHENRSVWLTGNSLFEVHKYEGSTFKVHIQQAFIEVKGTTFRIEQDKVEQNHITLFSGKVEFNIEATREKIEMHPFQKLTYNSLKASAQVREIPNIDWQNGRFYFTDIPLDHFIEIVNQMNDTCIKLGTGVSTHTVFTGSIRYNESVEEIAEKICYSLNLKKREKRDNAIIIHN